MLAQSLKACLNFGMDKSEAIRLLGGTISAAAAAVGVSPSAISQWPDPLPKRIEDRVLAALARKGSPLPVAPSEAPTAAPHPIAIRGDGTVVEHEERHNNQLAALVAKAPAVTGRRTSDKPR
jgi:hypothetical protein